MQMPIPSSHPSILRGAGAVSGEDEALSIMSAGPEFGKLEAQILSKKSTQYNALYTSLQRPPPSVSMHDTIMFGEHRLLLSGSSTQNVALPVPHDYSEHYATPHVAARATDLHFIARQRLENMTRQAPNGAVSNTEHKKSTGRGSPHGLISVTKQGHGQVRDAAHNDGDVYRATIFRII